LTGEVVGRARSADDLVRRVQCALDAAATAIELLLESEPEVGLDELEAPPDKLIAETSTLLRAVASVPADVAPDLAARVPGLVERLIPHARGPRVRAAIAMHPALARDYAMAHVSLAAAGWPDPELDRLLARSLADPASAGRERRPHRELEQVWLDRLRGEPTPSTEIVSRTALGTGIDLLCGSRDDVYALTHSIMYTTDFGATTTPLPRSAAVVLAETGSALAAALDGDDFDLAGELLLAWPLLGCAWDAVASFSFGVLARVEDEAGVLPSLAVDGDEYRRQSGRARHEYFAATTYHTAYVMGLLCAVLLRCGERPPGVSPDPVAADRLVEKLFPELEQDEHSAQWERDLELLPRGERGRLAPLLLDIAARRALRRVDLEALRETLVASMEHGVASTPLALQGVRLLSRLAHGLEAERSDRNPSVSRRS